LEVTELGALQPWHWVILLLVAVLLFGSKRLPDAARSLGKSMRIFKSEVKELQADNKSESTVTPQQPPTAAAPAQPTRVTSERVEAPAPDPTDVRPA
jgi:sec-independent protein translocase protein TatA